MSEKCPITDMACSDASGHLGLASFQPPPIAAPTSPSCYNRATLYNWRLSLEGPPMALRSSSRTERFKQGKALRQQTPREAHADLKGLLSRNAVALLAESDGDRVPELIPERYARMSLNPFAFLLGAAAVMATDLAAQPMAGIPVQAGGDSHLMNFGAFVTPEDNILFDVNDFDETLPGVDFTVDLKRLAASVAVAALAAGTNKKQARAIAAATVKAYRTHISALAKLSPLEIWHSRIDLEQEIDVIGSGALRRKLEIVIAR